MQLNVAEIPREAAGKLYASLITPRPVVLIGTVNAKTGGVNIAPFSSVSFVANHPPMIAISFSQRKGGAKDTLMNILATGELVVNSVNRNQSEKAIKAAESPVKILNEMPDDYLRNGFERIDFGQFKAGRIAGSSVALGCRLTTTHQLAPSACTLVIAEIECVYAEDDYLTMDLVVDSVRADLFASIGAEQYVSLEHAAPFILARTWE